MLSVETKRVGVFTSGKVGWTATLPQRLVQFSFRLLLSAVFVSTLPTKARSQTNCNSNDTGAPCFAGNTDILGGRRFLFPDDDLVVNTINLNTVNTPNGNAPVSAPSGANLLTNNSTITQTSPTLVSNAKNFSLSNVLSVQAQLFNLSTNFKHSQILSAAWVESLSNLQTSGVATLEGPDSSIPVPSLSVLANAKQLYGTSGDFLANGSDQIVVAAVHSGQLVFQVLAAVDPNNPESGLKAGPVSAPISNISSQFAITAGVFIDPQAAMPNSPAQIVLLSGSPTTNTGLVITFYSVDSNLNVSPTGKSLALNLAPTTDTTTVIAMAAGRFGGAAHDQLAIAYPAKADPSHTNLTVAITTVDFDATGDPMQEAFSDTGFPIQNFAPSSGYPPAIYLAKGNFNVGNNADQLGISLGTDGAGGMEMGVMYFTDSHLDGSLGFLYSASNSCHFGLAAGRFDSQGPNGLPDLNYQLADISTNCSSGGYTANIYGVDPTNTYAITLQSNKDVTGSIGGGGGGFGPPTGLGAQALSLVAVDEQGRSLALSAPTKVVVTQHIQPDTVLGVPPMHVDWISPSPGAAPQIFNVSVFPATFNTAYSFTDSTNGSVSRTGTTSYTFSTQETANEQVSYGVPDVASVSVEAKQAASQLQQNNISTQYNTYTGNTTTFTAATVFDDIVAATANQLNVYTYRVIGECGAPQTGGTASDDCPAGTVPVYIQIAGPDNVNYLEAAEGSNLEWYQPVQEPGNLFSYPATVEQLTADLGGGTVLNALTPKDDSWGSQATTVVTADWTQGGQNGTSAGTTSTHTFDASVSVSGSASFGGFGVSAGVGFDYNDSNSISTLYQSTDSFSSSTGIALNRGISGDATSQNYTYEGASLIYGQNQPGAIPLESTSPSGSFQVQGFIAAAHLADMMSQGLVNSGNFWLQAYTAAPDIALNHPQRWLQKTPSGVNDQLVQFHCPYGFTSLLTSPATPCTAASSGPAPQAIADDSFYEMKGLFVTPGGTFNGPQITSTTLGSTVNLRVRVYNYSLQNFPAGSTLHVQFYAQPWGLGQFATPQDNGSAFTPAVFIGSTTLAPPPAFCGGAQIGSDPCTTTGSSTNNWEYANTTWNTSTRGVTANSTWKFWVVVWVENNGQLVADLTGHGLTSLPADNVQYNSPADVPIETYSNNLGIYNQVFTVLPATQETSASGPKQLTLSQISTRNNAPVVRDVPITILAPHVASGDHIDRILTLYYDGDPAKGGTLFDMQNISRVQPGSPYIDAASYLPKACGEHEIFVRSIPTDGSARTTTATTTFKVTRDPVMFIDELITYLQERGSHRNKDVFSPSLRNSLVDRLRFVKRLFEKGQTRAATAEMESLLDLVQNGRLPFPEEARRAIAAQIKDLLGCV